MLGSDKGVPIIGPGDRHLAVSQQEEWMERSVEVLAIIWFGVFGLSHILQPKAWVEFFILLRGREKPAPSSTGF
jgi:hypothetical protein